MPRRRYRLDRRHPRWEQRLRAYLAEARDRPHDYGQHDCILHCAAGVRAVTGRVLAKGHVGRYDSALGAKRRLTKLGFESAAELLDSYFPSRNPLAARRGDLVMGEDGIPGICIGATAVFVGVLEQEPGSESGAGGETVRQGLVSAPRSAWTRAWTVGGEG